ncbi:hypothetical protein [Gordonia sp. (in: high G+C Gram-positive bacteria)]|uniref:hypothetical protein n=1 Tax=Gordonia sp. (in: high G+C Gram-positive bacteria) TaxID=84139 RepID=UPI003528FEC3
MDDGESNTSVIDELARVAAADRSGLDALWRAVFELDEWWFIARGLGADCMPGDDTHPFIGVLDGKPFLMAFTDGERARRFALANGLGAADGTAHALAIPPAGIVSTAPSYRQQGVFAIVFDHGSTGFFSPLEDLAAIQQWVR